MGKKSEKEEEEYITKEELMNDLREALTEMYLDRKNGVERKTLQEVIDEL